ncbi:hypothetical protein AB4072_05020 [Microvirga sp. 2MCAF38]|uniref:hypothetical protein n=1 Tax=Microvirga sp. 2MCAF38 TaxID=3232989 RepID=UPI003F994BBD
MSHVQATLSKLPDCDDTLRRLADILRVPSTCRKRACRIEGTCQGGYGPPCFFARRDFFSDALRENMPAYREHWDEQRKIVRAALQR